MLRRRGRTVIASPNIWHWPELYEVENRAQDVDGAIFAALREITPWSGRVVVDVGCGSGYHLPVFAEAASSVIGVEPHPPLVSLAQQRVKHLSHVSVLEGRADKLPLASNSVDVVHARTAYFFGRGCEPGINEALRVLRSNGILVIVDLDATAHPYGQWMREDLPHYNPGAVEAFFAEQGFSLRRVDTTWRFNTRQDLNEVIGIEFSPRVALRAERETVGLSLSVRYRIHTIQKTLVHPHRAGVDQR
ncbi:class I SAM-dependent methyltransferase [Hoyosella rhizosphaerae]|uniref:Methyltransferase type 11 n=1 Tax=Hoyosella rhizosphaerae TaxID=1755582 RepID=A0A916U6C4_9ACTN|nr:class I SAM-dependent methyltransferase [Hoyosella rhizosphaerae]MBN4926258.1 class I SAM-dependent methyltransferase [Hoyosella rhizosphaerae]GGC60829.1 methyltransferase type 11 [Hoyosella rhizosphaerae]